MNSTQEPWTRPALILTEGSPAGDVFARAVLEIFRFTGVAGEIVTGLREESSGTLVCCARALIGEVENGRLTAEKLARFTSVFIFAGGDKRAFEEILLLAGARSRASTSAKQVHVFVSENEPEISGPFAGLAFGEVWASDLLWFHEAPGLISLVKGLKAGIGFGRAGNFYFCGAAGPLDLTASHPRKLFDIKRCFFQITPLLMFLQHAFGGFPRKSPGPYACLMVDDPLLREAYGRFRFREVLAAIAQHKFALNVGLIPWNFERSDRRIVELLRSHPRASLAVHGCNHTQREFEERNLEQVNWLAAVALQRMASHQARYSAPFEKIMIFPEGAFSAEAAVALRENNYLAAVNTLICASEDTVGPSLNDIFEPAVMKYGNFPIISRRYFDHGIENFAFDLLLGKPCLIATHHYDYRDQMKPLLRALEKISALPVALSWRPLGEIVRALYKLDRENNLWVFSNEIILRNTSGRSVDLCFRKPGFYSASINGRAADQSIESGVSVLHHHLEAGGTVHLQYLYRSTLGQKSPGGWLHREKTRWRRHASEFRDHVLMRPPTIRPVDP